jgi:hypothetical protein
MRVCYPSAARRNDILASLYLRIALVLFSRVLNTLGKKYRATKPKAKCQAKDGRQPPPRALLAKAFLLLGHALAPRISSEWRLTKDGA